MKILNLYAGIGGNRKLWKDVEVTAIENNREIAKIYQDFFPDDKVIVTDAHKYLLEHYNDQENTKVGDCNGQFDLIWSSPPCQTHSDIRRMNVDIGMSKPVYPDMRLYQEVILLKHFCKSKWVVENVKPYYISLMPAQKSGRHYFWANFNITNMAVLPLIIRNVKIKDSVLFGKKLTTRKDAVIRSMVNSKLGLHILECAFKEKQKRLTGEIYPSNEGNVIIVSEKKKY